MQHQVSEKLSHLSEDRGRKADSVTHGVSHSVGVARAAAGSLSRDGRRARPETSSTQRGKGKEDSGARLSPLTWTGKARPAFPAAKRKRPPWATSGENPARYRTGFALHIRLFAVSTDAAREVWLSRWCRSLVSGQSERV
jgi:hypothetical protein